jgi:hypothetical protein
MRDLEEEAIRIQPRDAELQLSRDGRNAVVAHGPVEPEDFLRTSFTSVLAGPDTPEDWIVETAAALWEVDASINADGDVELRFSDESIVLLGRTSSSARDAGLRLLEPITATERGAIERILTILGEAQQAGSLTPWQEHQIILMADLIRTARDEAVPEVTERWKVVGVVGGALRYLARELPEDVVKWAAAGVVLSNIDWNNLAAALPG